ncbi:hypothetical protein N7463_001856 [Penicillium fimorum]|uniref:Uncharacterized protein n=1 Tax=Penicillium fimorum TaxID=1882269 RepID=A0A9W9XXY9_9EURO|nr:hypothetical protein N7463_001856 [Penicillium fimorum]
MTYDDLMIQMFLRESTVHVLYVPSPNANEKARFAGHFNNVKIKTNALLSLSRPSSRAKIGYQRHSPSY